MKILVIVPGKHPEIAEILNSLEACQKIVGGYIEVVRPWNDEVVMVMDEEGVIKRKPFNRLINRLPIYGTFFLCGVEGEEFKDLPEDMVNKYMEKLYKPEMLVQSKGRFKVWRFDD